LGGKGGGVSGDKDPSIEGGFTGISTGGRTGAGVIGGDTGGGGIEGGGVIGVIEGGGIVGIEILFFSFSLSFSSFS